VRIQLVLDTPIPFAADYTRDYAERCFYDLSFVGGSRYKDGVDCCGEKTFVEHEQESEKSGKRRKRLSVFRNYCKPILSRYNNFIFGNAIRRDMDPAFQEWAKDVDLLGTSLHHFMKKTVLCAQKFGRAFIMVETSKTAEYQTVAQAQAAGNRVFFIELHPDRVVNWTMHNSTYTQVLIHYPDLNKLCLYDEVNYQEAMLDDKGKIASIGALTPHNFGGLPVICCTAFDDGLSQLRDVAEVNKQLFYYDSLLAEELSKQTFTQAWIIDYDPDANEGRRAVKAIAQGSRKYNCIPPDPEKTTPKLEKMSADISQAQSISNSIKDDIQEIYRLAGLYDFTSDAMGQRASGNSLQIKFNEITLMAASICQNAEKAENTLIDFYNRLSSSKVIHSHYPESDELDTESFTNELKITLDVLGSTLPIVIKQEQVRSFAQIAYPRLPAALAVELEGQIQEMADEPETEPDPEDPADEKDDEKDGKDGGEPPALPAPAAPAAPAPAVE